MQTPIAASAHDVAGHMLALGQFPLSRSLNNFRYHKNPILRKGAPGEWDDGLIRDPMVFYDNAAPADEKFKLYYCGSRVASDGRMQIGLAYGSSLECLRKHPGNPVVTMTEPWENAKIEPAAVPDGEYPALNHTPFVFQIPAAHGYEMLYTARGCDENGDYYFSTARVTSPDGKNWGNKKQVFTTFELAGRNYSPTKPIPIYRAEEARYYLVFSGSLLTEACAKNEGFVGLATSATGEDYAFEQVIVPQDQAHSIFDPHGLVTMLGWYFLLITHDGDHAFDGDGNAGYPERWMVSRDLRTWYGSPLSIWDTYPDDGILYSHVSLLLTEAGMAYLVYDYGEPNVFGLARIPLGGRPYNVILEKPVLAPGHTTPIADSYPAISLESGQSLTLTVECAYEESAGSPARVHVFTSYDGSHWDTEEQTDAAGNPVFGAVPLAPGRISRRTRQVSLAARFVKVAVTNTDPGHPLRDVKVVATF